MIRDIENGKITADKVENTIITIPSNELSRARGGSHCMTCPIEREALD
jgi:arginine deiminase